MNKPTKFTEEYKNRLSAKTNEITEYLQLKTGYNIKMSVENSKTGYVYRLKISLGRVPTI